MNLRFRCGLDADPWVEQEGDGIWNRPLPGHSLTEVGESTGGRSATYGELFALVEHWITERFSGNVPFMETADDPGICRWDLQQTVPITIRIVKHGACYHVCRVTLPTQTDGPVDLAVNVAVTPTGLAVIERDFECMRTLCDRSPDPVLPKVYGFERMSSFRGRVWGLFATEWLVGYSEFHPSFDPEKNRLCVRVWDDEAGGYFLDETAERLLYRKIAVVLTLLYDVRTGSEVHPWHHAAGDFVVRRSRDDIHVRLITVRGYAPLFEPPTDIDPRTLWTRLLVFLCHLSIRNRIDRIDGVGDFCWSEEWVVEETMKGFADALKVHAQRDFLPGGTAEGFWQYVSTLDPVAIYEICDRIVASYPQNAPEIDIIRDHLIDHAGSLYVALNACCGG